MNLLDFTDIPQSKPSRLALTQQATKLITRRPTSRSKNKKPTKSAKWQREFKQAMINQQILKSQYKELVQQKKDYVRLIGE